MQSMNNSKLIAENAHSLSRSMWDRRLPRDCEGWLTQPGAKRYFLAGGDITPCLLPVLTTY